MLVGAGGGGEGGGIVKHNLRGKSLLIRFLKYSSSLKRLSEKATFFLSFHCSLLSQEGGV